MAICPICSSVSAGKRISFKNFELFDLCVRCASYSICLISPNVDVSVKENAIRWADTEIARNHEKYYLANCIRSWKQTAEEFVAFHKPVVNEEPKSEPVYEIDSGAINLDATIQGFNNGNFSAVVIGGVEKRIDASFFTSKSSADKAPSPAPDSEFIPSQPLDEPSLQKSASLSREETIIEPAYNDEPIKSFTKSGEYYEAASQPCFSCKNEATVPEENQEPEEAFISHESRNEESEEPFIEEGLSAEAYLREIALTLLRIEKRLEKAENDINYIKNTRL